MESNITTCRRCQLPKVRTLVGKFDLVNKRYVDENNKLWNGKVCADCHRAKQKENMQNKRKVVICQ